MEVVMSVLSQSNPVLLTHQPYGGPHLHQKPLQTSTKRSIVHPVLSSHSHGRSVMCPIPKANAEKQQQQQQQQDEEEDLELVTSIRSAYNNIMIVDTPNSRLLILDSSYNVHSILYKDKKWTDSYWDEFASLAPIVPKGPIAMLGLGGGTAAHLMLDLWPELQLEGWEIDQILIDSAREHFGLADLEKRTKAGGVLNIHIGDALSPSVNIPGGYAGIVVDLFSNGAVLPQLQEVTTWLEIKNWLMPDGRIMVNCGGSIEESDMDSGTSSSNASSVQNSAIKALSKAFPGQLSWKRKPKENGANYMALTGPMPDLELWSAKVPDPLAAIVKEWILYEDFRG